MYDDYRQSNDLNLGTSTMHLAQRCLIGQNECGFLKVTPVSTGRILRVPLIAFSSSVRVQSFAFAKVDASTFYNHEWMPFMAPMVIGRVIIYILL